MEFQTCSNLRNWVTPPAAPRWVPTQVPNPQAGVSLEIVRRSREFRDILCVGEGHGRHVPFGTVLPSS